MPAAKYQRLDLAKEVSNFFAMRRFHVVYHSGPNTLLLPRRRPHGELRSTEHGT